MNAEEIARFLRSHPQFFDQHPELLESILVQIGRASCRERV